MPAKIRKADINDFEPLMRFLEKSYGHRRNYFSENYAYLLKDVFGAGEGEPKGSYIVENNGKILSHVGLYPLKLVCAGVKITAGGIGNVATHPEARGRGYMGKLLRRAVSDMENGDVPLSVLWGDRQRYGNFGWETAGQKLNLHFSARSLKKSGAKRVKDIEEVDPKDAVSEIRKFQKNITFRAERGKKLKGIISRNSNRVWLSKDGYLCGADVNGLRVNEVYSSSGSEAGLIFSAMEWAGRGRASHSVCARDGGLISKLLPRAASWDTAPEGMFRVNSFNTLLGAFAPVLEERAKEIAPGDFSILLETGGEKTGLSLLNGNLRLAGDCKEGKPVLISESDAVRLFLGGPVLCPKELEPLKALLPLPLHIPGLDHV